MKATLLRFITLLAVALFVTSLTAQVDNRDFDLGGGGGIGSCRICEGGSFNGVMHLSCGSPDPGGWGRQNCRIESYPEGTYCFVDGNDCCVD